MRSDRNWAATSEQRRQRTSSSDAAAGFLFSGGMNGAAESRRRRQCRDGIPTNNHSHVMAAAQGELVQAGPSWQQLVTANHTTLPDSADFPGQAVIVLHACPRSAVRSRILPSTHFLPLYQSICHFLHSAQQTSFRFCQPSWMHFEGSLSLFREPSQLKPIFKGAAARL